MCSEVKEWLRTLIGRSLVLTRSDKVWLWCYDPKVVDDDVLFARKDAEKKIVTRKLPKGTVFRIVAHDGAYAVLSLVPKRRVKNAKVKLAYLFYTVLERIISGKIVYGDDVWKMCGTERRLPK